MSHCVRSLRIASLVLIFTTFGFSQKTGVKDSLQSKILTAAREIMMEAPNCSLITVDGEGTARVRMMDPFAPEEDFTVWFGTNPKSRKVVQIENNPKVTLYYLESNGSGYVALHGKAELINDATEKQNRWKEDWKAFYRNNEDDYLLIKVTPNWVEVVSYAHGIVSTASNWQPPVVYFDSN